ncbi:MAG: S1 RNA-binding domain-containing protein, partial [Pseudomonadota bacterium]|nr:S1 RNA-binding domain-containing protein [Pseudomonadota bacterium]
NAGQFTDEHTGELTLKDILSELEKPGRDPRPEFRFAEYKEGVEDIKDLKPGMILEGAITNVAAFGAFVDIGVHQDGLVHISALADHFVKDPRDVVKAGDIVKVKVMEVDVSRKRIGLSMRLSDDTPAKSSSGTRQGTTRSANSPKATTRRAVSENSSGAMGGAFAQAFANAKKRKK